VQQEGFFGYSGERNSSDHKRNAKVTDQVEPFVDELSEFFDDNRFPAVISNDFQRMFGERLDDVLDIERWRPGQDLAELYDRLSAEVAEAVQFETNVRRVVRTRFFPQIRTATVPQSGVYRVSPSDIEHAHKHSLFNGAVEACDANLNGYDTLPITILQIGVSLVRYNGSESTWVNRLFRRDLRAKHDDIYSNLTSLLDERDSRGGHDQDHPHDQINQLVRRGIMRYAERAALLKHSTAPWRMGHGMPAPFDLLTGSGSEELLDASIDLLHELIETHKRVLFVPSSPGGRGMLTIGEALDPLEYMIYSTQEESLLRIVSRNRFSGRVQQRALNFARAVGPQIVVGMYRAAANAPVQVFYTHRDYAHEAALLCIADSVLQAYRGFPLLIDLADTACRNSLGIDTLVPSVDTAFAEAGVHFRYMPERYNRTQRGRS